MRPPAEQDRGPRAMTATAPVFVVGPPRAGTTLAATILGGHPDLYATGETHFCEDILARYGDAEAAGDRGVVAAAIDRLRTLYARYNEPAAQARITHLLETDDGLARLRGARDLTDLWDRFMRLQMSEPQLRWVNHVPRDIFFLDDLRRRFPGARFIGMVRDPRDFLLSYREKGQDEGGPNRNRLRRLYHPVMTALLWRASVRRLLDAADGAAPDILLLRYEDLVADPAAGIGQLCRFLGLAHDPAMQTPAVANSSHAQADGGHRSGHIYGDSVGRFAGPGGLDATELWLCQRLCAAEMQRLAYVPARSGLPWCLPLVLAGLPWRIVSGLWANRGKRGPLLAYLRRRLGA